MTVQERRQHFRINDQLYFDYRIIEEGRFISEQALAEELLGENNQKYLETSEYFQNIDRELMQLTGNIALRDPETAHYLNLMNAKIDYLSRHLLVENKLEIRSVNLSLGGLAFKSNRKLSPKTRLKVIIYTKPKMIPLLLNAFTVSCVPIPNHRFRISLQFEGLDVEQEQLLAQHIMLAQVQRQVDS
ncbi:MAG: PilZ domain-containing protein [Legionellaceae bacterium]|nr:PilZ domain-containing protein [Legionellaceae bacterium]